MEHVQLHEQCIAWLRMLDQRHRGPAVRGAQWYHDGNEIAGEWCL